MRRFPLYVSLEGKKILVVGGGHIALRRIRTLLEFGPEIFVCAKALCPDLEKLCGRQDITYCAGEYKKDFLEGAFFVLAATDDREVNHQVYRDCRETGILANVSDCREECGFYFPAVALKEEIVVGISGDGTAHGKVRDTAQKIRELLEAAQPGQRTMDRIRAKLQKAEEARPGEIDER